MPPKRERPITPEEQTLPAFDIRIPGTEYDTPHKASLHSIWAWEEYNGRKPDTQEICRFLQINKTQGYEILKSDTVRTLNNQPGPNPRARKPRLSNQKSQEIEDLLDNEHDAQYLTWTQLAMEVGVEAAENTIRSIMKRQGFVDGIAKQKPSISEKTAIKRVERAEGQLFIHPSFKDWQNVLFSDEVHFGWSDEGRLHIKRRIGTRNTPEHIQHPREPRVKDRKRFHCFAMVGWNFKSDIHFYDSSNENGKMTQKAYIEQILELVVKPLIDKGKDFVLFEDGDSGHGPSKSNPVRTWKEKHGLKHYFNVSNSPDLNIIENCWLPPKQYTRKFPHWSDEETRALIIEGWARVSQEYINGMVKSYPQRFQDVLKVNGQLTGW